MNTNEADNHKGRKMRWVLALLWTAVFLYLLTAFNPADSSLVTLAGNWSQRLGLKPGALMKVGHVFGYFLMALFWCGALSNGYREPLPRKARVWLPLSVLLLAATTEALQGLNPARHPAWLDVGYNVVGAMIGFGGRYLLVRRKAQPRTCAPFTDGGKEKQACTHT